MDIHYCFREFLDYMASEKNASKLTLGSYETDFNVFTNFLSIGGIEPRLCAMTTQVLRRYVSYLKLHKGYKTNTVRRKIHSISSFFKYLLETEYIEKNPMLPIHAPKEEKHLPIYLKEHELKRLLETPEKYARFPEHRLRDKVMIELLVFTGARRSEVLSMDFDDIDFGKKTITIKKGKGNKQRVVPLIEPLASDLWEYLQERLPLSNKAILVSDLGSRMSVSNFQTLFRRYLDKSGLGKKGYTIHKVRHSYASLLHQQGVDIISIKELLGHEDLNSTKIYTHTTVNHLRKQVEKFPLSIGN
ncbi:tyrosine-type recombinase/integrase [Brassicibacter mesophilus]|uniref:tyrosine-type recombinase/integrase n=1 Tax=Brassicibacter mesophilus TaxID=745119 RepID=UPI003D1F2A67